MRSIFIYWLFYAVVLLFTYISSKSKGWIQRVFVFLAIITMSVFAACRAYSVGTDIKVYGLSTFENCFKVQRNLGMYLNIYGGEYLYYILNWLVALKFKDYHVFLFLLQFISSCLIFKIAYDNKDKCNIVFVVFVYLMVWYNTSLNLLRQTTAVMIMLYAFKYLKQNQFLKYILCIAISFFFHASSIVCLVFIVLKKIEKNKYVKLYAFLMFVGIAVMLSQMTTIFNIIPFLSKKYLVYITNVDGNIRYKYLFVKILIILFIYYFNGKTEDKYSKRLMLYAVIYDTLFYFSSAFIKFGYRTSYFFLPYLIILLPSIGKDIKENKYRLLYFWGCIVLLIFQWLVRYYIIGYDGVFPIVFE